MTPLELTAYFNQPPTGRARIPSTPRPRAGQSPAGHGVGAEASPAERSGESGTPRGPGRSTEGSACALPAPRPGTTRGGRWLRRVGGPPHARTHRAALGAPAACPAPRGPARPPLQRRLSRRSGPAPARRAAGPAATLARAALSEPSAGAAPARSPPRRESGHTPRMRSAGPTCPGSVPGRPPREQRGPCRSERGAGGESSIRAAPQHGPCDIPERKV